MTNEELLQDLKQFVTATVSQSTAELKTDLGGRIAALEQNINSLRTEMNGRFDEVLKSELIKSHDEAIKDYGIRITRLEHKLA